MLWTFIAIGIIVVAVLYLMRVYFKGGSQPCAGGCSACKSQVPEGQDKSCDQPNDEKQ